MNIKKLNLTFYFTNLKFTMEKKQKESKSKSDISYFIPTLTLIATSLGLLWYTISIITKQVRNHFLH